MHALHLWKLSFLLLRKPMTPRLRPRRTLKNCTILQLPGLRGQSHLYPMLPRSASSGIKSWPNDSTRFLPLLAVHTYFVFFSCWWYFLYTLLIMPFPFYLPSLAYPFRAYQGSFANSAICRWSSSGSGQLAQGKLDICPGCFWVG
jgi:hypothetical protein